MELLGKNDFLKKYNIDRNRFDQTDLAWNDLVNIFNDYKRTLNDLEMIAQFMSNVLNKAPRVHSTKYRIKNPEHLIEKIVRKKIEKGMEISFSDYNRKVTDTIGVRVLHLFKEDWLEIDKFIKEKFEVIEGPRAHIGNGDDDSDFIKNNCIVVRHELGYRSVHYLVKVGFSKQQFVAEIQVRTIFEEGWSEIDHKLKYPYVKDNLVLERLLFILNRFAASADELGSFVNHLQGEFDKKQQVIGELMDRINTLNINNPDKDILRDGIEMVGNLFLSEPKKIEAKPVIQENVAVVERKIIEPEPRPEPVARKDIGRPEPLTSASPNPEPIKERMAQPGPIKIEQLEKKEQEIGPVPQDEPEKVAAEYDYKEILEQRRAMEGQSNKGRKDFVSIMDIINHNKKSPPA